MKTNIQPWHDRKESDLWLHEKVLHTDLQYAAQEIAELRQYCLELESRVRHQEPVIANQQAMNNSLRESVTGFLSVNLGNWAQIEAQSDLDKVVQQSVINMLEHDKEIIQNTLAEVSADQMVTLKQNIADLLKLLHPGVVGLIHEHHGKDACDKACEVISRIKSSHPLDQ
ncbi:hypothetical protein [Undibacterium oligocarboniphilum]|uniref:Uncharacterized protein n=1 Tax=Undibacterium oligocarboniphilum TaxID=666702 RepID=A0A850QK04_9BURK|nr:hypothetical protein [Undibacterium oligocarboniphilum]MBC3871753.1 hypothetical protein [Undibacterium oligocarboniphilum]NVO79389.1 hypothetical protein [Undibacterium oligocarboniphilum]